MLWRPAAVPSVRDGGSMRVWAISVLCLATALAATPAAASYVLLDHDLVGVDDANIYGVRSQRRGGPWFIYNAGGERVEGFTSLARTLVTAAPSTCASLSRTGVVRYLHLPRCDYLVRPDSISLRP
jgi:hypothetical protein